MEYIPILATLGIVQYRTMFMELYSIQRGTELMPLSIHYVYTYTTVEVLLLPIILSYSEFLMQIQMFAKLNFNDANLVSLPIRNIT